MQKQQSNRFFIPKRIRNLLKEREPVINLKTWQAVLLYFGIAFLTEFLIEALSRHSLNASVRFVTHSFKVYLYNVLLIYVTSLAAFLFRKRRFVAILIFGLWLAAGITNGVILSCRVTPFTGPDFKNMTEGLAVAGKYINFGKMSMMVLGILCVGILLILLLFRTPRCKGKKNYVLTVILLASAAGGFYGVTRYALKARIISNYFGNIAYAYQDYGFPYCFSVTLLDTGINEPNDYSSELIDTILSEDIEKTKETTLSESDMPNIIVVQCETFFDPTRVSWLKFSEDPLPNWHRLVKEYTSGLYTVPIVGAGTVNSEFETLTGMSLRFFGVGEYPFKGVLKKEPCESIAYDLKQIGYTAHVIHDNEATFYSRRTVYKNLGFDEFTSGEYMEGQEDVNDEGWMRDENLIGPINDALDSTPGADFITTITVQPHGAYPTEGNPEEAEITVTGAATEEENCQWTYYVNQLYEEDRFIADLIASIEKRDEKTVILFYGDHLPTMGLSDTDIKGSIYQTNYLIWDNLGLPEEDENITAYRALAGLTDKLGIHEGTMFRYQQAHKTSEDEYYADMQSLQYDILYGERYVYGGDDPYCPNPFFRMGVKDVILDRVEKVSDDYLYVYGKNFTQCCCLMCDGETLDTIFLNNTTLMVSSEAVEEGSTVYIAVQSDSSSHTDLSYSNSVTIPIETPVEQTSVPVSTDKPETKNP